MGRRHKLQIVAWEAKIDFYHDNIFRFANSSYSDIFIVFFL